MKDAWLEQILYFITKKNLYIFLQIIDLVIIRKNHEIEKKNG